MEHTKFYQSAIYAGAALGGVFVLYKMLLYLFEVNMFSVGFGLLDFILTVGIFIVVMIYSGKNVRKTQFDNYMSYGNAFIYTLVVGVAASIVIALFYYLYYSFADLAYIQNQVDDFLYSMQQRGLTESQLQDLQDLQNKLNEQLNTKPPKQALNGFIFTSIMSVVLALLVAIFVKQNRPAYDEGIS